MKQILITGAASGIGLDLTQELLRAGNTVWAGARKPETLNPLQKKYPKTLFPVKQISLNVGEL